MCTVATFVHPAAGFPGVAPRAAPVHDVDAAVWRRMATYVETSASLCGHHDGGGYDDDDDAADMEALLRDIDVVVHLHTPAGLTPQSVAADSCFEQPMPSAEFLALSRQEEADVDAEALLRGVRSVQVRATSCDPVPVAYDDIPVTPVGVAKLEAPLSYGDDAAEGDGAATLSKNQPETRQTCSPAPLSNKRPEPSQTYDAAIDATFRAMEKKPAERPSAVYLWTTQDCQMTMAERAELVAWMDDISGYHNLAAGTLHRAVSYVDRFLSVKKIFGGAHELRLLGGVAVFAAAKYEDSKTTWVLDADGVAEEVGCTRCEVIAAERELVATLGYCLSGPTAYTFVDHFTRNEQESPESAAVRSLAHHFANMALLDYRCLQFYPSAVAAAAIVLARMVLNSTAKPSVELKVAWYTFEDLAGCMDAIYEMHELKDVWPGCAQMMAYRVQSYSLPPRRSTCNEP